MKYVVLTTQPNIYNSFLETGLIARGISKDIINVEIKSLYDYATDPHHSIDDTPYGGGAGMVIRVDIIDKAISTLKSEIRDLKHGFSKSETNSKSQNPKIILLTPQGKKFDQKMVKKLAKEKELILISGRFEGFDERIRDLVDEEVSIGDYVLTSGDLPAMVLIDSISRQIPGFIDRKESIKEESFAISTLEYPQYTRPEKFQGKSVPKVLLSGNHGEIAKWRKEEAEKRTKKRRPDLI